MSTKYKARTAAGKEMLRALDELDKWSQTVDRITDAAKTSGGRLTPFGRIIVVAGLEAGLRPADLARFLKITPAAIIHIRNATKETEECPPELISDTKAKLNEPNDI